MHTFDPFVSPFTVEVVHVSHQELHAQLEYLPPVCVSHYHDDHSHSTSPLLGLTLGIYIGTNHCAVYTVGQLFTPYQVTTNEQAVYTYRISLIFTHWYYRFQTFTLAKMLTKQLTNHASLSFSWGDLK